jgi:hypothetical protein
MNAYAFNQLPYLLRLRQVLACGFKAHTVLDLVREQTLHPVSTGRHNYYRRAEIGPLIGVPVDWQGFDRLPELLRRGHLVGLGIESRCIERLRLDGRLGVLNDRAPRKRFYKFDAAELVGRNGQD